IGVLRKARNEVTVESRPGEAQKCTHGATKALVDCHVQVRRIEFVGPQVGSELVEKGGLALIYTLIAILVYVLFRFEWRFAVASIVAVAHDVLVTFGFFSLTQIEFSLPVLAATLAVLGYSLNDTIVVFDRIRENFRRMRRAKVVDIMNSSINQTLSRTIITSGTTMLTVLALFFLGGEIIHGFSTALIVGIVVGTYSSIYIATPVVLALGISREDLMPAKKEEAEPTRP
ncbi:MAG: protein translocase subunit SecF, partial [Acidiferrobacterales bacterium]